MKVLIISSPFFGYHESVGRAFSELGYEVKVEAYDEPIHPFKGLLKWRHKLAENKEKLRAKSRAKYDAYIRSVYEKYQPGIVFLYNGSIMQYATLDYFRRTSKVLIWMYDSVSNPRYARCREHVNHSDAMFCFDKSDVDYYESIGKKACFLPLACDASVYHPAISKKKDIDILFVGQVWGVEKRIRLLKLLVAKYPQLNIAVYGKYKPIEKGPLTWLLREKRNVFKNVNIPPEKTNELFNRCRIALNIHHGQTVFGANPRVFEACGAGAYQICDANPFVESLFPNGEVGLYRNEEELTACIDDALQSDKSENARRAQGIVLSGHTFLHRVKEMLVILNSEAAKI
jgi:spore maturation protein CgeB